MGNGFVYFLLVICTAFDTTQTDYTIIKKSTTEVQLIQNNKIIDYITISYSCSWKYRCNQSIKIIDDKVYKIDLIIPPLDNFAGAYWEISAWRINNNKFQQQKTLKFKPKEDFNNLKLSIKKDGIHWKYKATENRQSKKGIISFSELK